MALDDISLGRNTILYMKVESTAGTFEYPVGSDAVRVIVESHFSQPGKEHLPDMEFRPDFSKTAPIAGVYPEGDFEFTCYNKPVAAGTVPNVDVPLRSWFRKAPTIVGATSVTYNLGAPTDPLITFTAVFKKGNITFFCAGCKTTDFTEKVMAGNEEAAIGQITFSGKFLKQKFIGTTAVNNVAGYIATSTDIIVDNAKLVQVDTRCKFGTEDNGGLGYLVTAVNTGTNTITISPGLANGISDNDVVSGFVPTASFTGFTVHGQYGIMTEDNGGGAVNTVIVEAEVTGSHPVTIAHEKTDDPYPSIMSVSADREVAFTPVQVHRDSILQLWYDANEVNAYDIVLPVGSTAGKKYAYNINNYYFRKPDIAGDREDHLNITREGQATATSPYDNEMTLAYT